MSESTGPSTDAAARGYLEGERVFAPPQGSFDAAWVANLARSADPGLPEPIAQQLAAEAWQHVREIGELDAPELARRLLADHPGDATPATVVAKAAVDFCRSYQVDPTAR